MVNDFDFNEISNESTTNSIQFHWNNNFEIGSSQIQTKIPNLIKDF